MSQHEEQGPVDGEQDGSVETPASEDPRTDEVASEPATQQEEGDASGEAQAPDDGEDAPTSEGDSGQEDGLEFLSPEDSDAEAIEVVAQSEATSGDDAEEAPEEEPPNPFELLLERERQRVKALEESLASMTAERDDFKSRLLRSAADLENFRKRKEREKEGLRKYGAERVVADLLPAIDNLERALEHAEKSEEQSSISDGVKMVHRQLQSALEKHGIKGFSALGERFDPQLHEAIQQVETTEHETGMVMQEFQKGYYIHDRLLRPAMTVVAKNVAPVVSSAPDESETPTQESQADEGVIEMGEQEGVGAESSDASA